MLPLTNLAEQYVAGVGESTTSSRLDSWASQVGGYTAVGSADRRPTIGTDLQGRPVVHFPYHPTATLLTRVISDGPAYDARAISIWVVARLNGGHGTLVSVNGYAGGSGHLRLVASGSVPSQVQAVGHASGLRAPLNIGVYGVAAGASSTIIHDATTSVSKPAVTADATNTGGVEIGAFSATGFLPMDVYEVLIYSAAQSAQDQADTKVYLAAKYGVATTHPANMIVFEGDSITSGVGSTLNKTAPALLAQQPAITANWLLFNNGASGSTVATQASRAAALDALLADPQTRKVLANQIGRNDLATQDAAAFYAALVGYESPRVTAGWEVWDCTNIATANGTIQGKIAAANILRRSNLQADSGVSQIIDLAADPAFDTAADASDAHYSDGTHLTSAGYALAAALIAPYLEPQEVAPTITSASTKSGQVGVPLSYTITATGTAPITFGVSGALPFGVTFDGTATITGTPTTAGVRVATITATNSAGEDSDTLTFTIAAAPTPGPTSGNLSLFNQLAEAVGATGGHRYNLDALNAISQQLTGSAGHTRNLAALNAIAGHYIGSPQSFTLNIDALNAITGKLGAASNNTRTVDALAGWLGKL